MPVKMIQYNLYIVDSHGKPCEVSEITDITENLFKDDSDADESILRLLKTSNSITFSCTMSKKDARRFRRVFGLTWYWRLYYRIIWKINRLIRKEKKK